MTRWRDSQKACDGQFRGDRPQLFDRQRVFQRQRQPSLGLEEACAIDEGALRAVGRRALREGSPRREDRPRLTGSEFNYNPPPMDTPAAAEYVSGSYAPLRADVLADEDWEDTKGNWVESARAAITARLAQLRRVIALDNADASEGDQRFANDQRQRLFTEIKQQIRTVFGPNSMMGTGAAETDLDTGVLTGNGAGPITHEAWTAHVDYPVNSSGVAQDAGVLAQIQDVLAAFAGKEAFAAAFDSGGLFADQKENNATRFADGYPTPGAIFDRPRGKLSIAARATDYTRFGGWSHQVSAFAAAALGAHSYDGAPVTYTEGGTEETSDRARGAEFGAFAYSPLDPVAPYSTSSRLYPAQTADVTATYAGRTAAAQGGLFYTGAVEAKVFWTASDVTDSRVTVEISDLEDTVNGDPLQFGYARDGYATDNLVDVESLTWTAAVTNTGTVKFASSAPVTVGANTVSGAPPYRPAYGGGVNADMALRRRDRGNGNTDELRIRRSANEFWVLSTGTSTTGNNKVGALTFKGINTGNVEDVNPTTTSGADFNAARDAFVAGQAALDYPTHLVRGIQINRTAAGTGGQPATGPRDSLILLFADGSTAMMDEDVNHNTGLLGGANAALDDYTAARYTDTPALNTPEAAALVFNDAGLPWSKDFLTLDGDGTTVIGNGGPVDSDGDALNPGDLAAVWLRANDDYVNVLESDTGARASEINGMFVGADQDGPLGLIGTWELTGGAFGLGTERGPIRGAFGADIQP